MKTLEEYLKIDYPIRTEHIIEKDNKYYLAWLPAFGKSTCSATGNTEEEAISNLKQVKETVIQYYYFKSINRFIGIRELVCNQKK